MVRIDAHHHFWQLARGDYGWLTPALAPIYRDFCPGDLAPLLQASGIDGTILVQAAPTFAETLYLLELAGPVPFVAGVVGWIDFDAADAAQTVARVAAEHPLLVGLRPMLHDIADDDWLLRPNLAAVFDAMAEHGLVFDALARPQHLPRVQKMCERHPNLTVVVDHIAKPLIRDKRLDPWRADLAAVARCANAVCKASGIATEAAPNGVSPTSSLTSIMSSRPSDRSVCCGAATGRWSISQAAMNAGGMRRKPCWRRSTPLPGTLSLVATRRASI